MCDGCGADCLAPLRSKKMMKEIEKLSDCLTKIQKEKNNAKDAKNA